MIRRHRPNALAPSPSPRWLKVYDMQRTEISSRELPPFHDLQGELQREADRWAAQGWTIEGAGGRSAHGSFFMNRAGERRLVSITRDAEPVPAHSTPSAGRR